ncbi:septal ring lytic transglycosylase RlpA family protein [Kiloniella antarctica]|uniref:Endolytic peptidoglycan transglycosylase RlpA n=1 Tax=Kiloniella antarctica TaxID=1550907 RepID=A0ABW5BPM8_9PROT
MRLRKSYGMAACICALTIGLSGCAEIELASHATKQIVSTNETKSKGRFKVGSPYQVKKIWYYPAVDYGYSETGIASWYGPGFDGKTTANGEIYDQYALTAAHRTLPMPSLVRVTNLGNGRSIKLRVNDRGPFSNNRIIDVSRRSAQLLGFEVQGTAKVKVEILEDESRQLAAQAQGEEYIPQVASSQNTTLAAPTDEVTAEPLGASQGTSVEPVQSASHTSVRAEPVANFTDGVVTQTPLAPSGIYVQAGSFLQIHNADRLRARLASLGTAQVANAPVGSRTFYRVRLGPLSNVEEADKLLQILHDNGYNEARVIVD